MVKVMVVYRKSHTDDPKIACPVLKQYRCAVCYDILGILEIHPRSIAGIKNERVLLPEACPNCEKNQAAGRRGLP